MRPAHRASPTPGCFADRIGPGDGPISLAALIAATRATGYDRPWIAEIFSVGVSNPLYDGDLKTVVERRRSGMAAAWATSQTD